MRLPLLPLQKAIYDQLKISLACSVHDVVPDGAVPPYVTIGEYVVTDRGDKLRSGVEVVHTSHIWSNYKGMAEVNQLADQIVQALTDELLPVVGFQLVSSQLEGAETLRDPDGYAHGVVRIRFRITEV